MLHGADSAPYQGSEARKRSFYQTLTNRRFAAEVIEAQMTGEEAKLLLIGLIEHLELSPTVCKRIASEGCHAYPTIH
jgi:hypothetical protein